ncbi:hypothetical protein [Devosia sp.]|uniref:hypothetical protein n=1 Tax=Devosia sp. TaxID=1871048 RepID=UPI003F71B911
MKVSVPTEAQLRAMSPEQRMTIRTRAEKMDNDTGRATVELIDALHLPLSSGGLSMDHPIYREMAEVIWSSEGKAAAVDAVAKALPAMAGVDPLLQMRMGERYGREYQGTMNAGSLVAEVMRYLGYKKTGEAELPEGCVAKTAATWQKR